MVDKIAKRGVEVQNFFHARKTKSTLGARAIFSLATSSTLNRHLGVVLLVKVLRGWCFVLTMNWEVWLVSSPEVNKVAKRVSYRRTDGLEQLETSNRSISEDRQPLEGFIRW